MEKETKEFFCRGHRYKVLVLDRTVLDPSWYSHEDEAAVRERDWDVKPGDVVFDVGSAYGSYALTALAVGASAAHCWNPDAGENETLAGSARENGWEDRLFIHEVGIGSPPRAALFTPSFTEGPEKPFRIETLDSQVVSLGIGRADWLKVDVEGLEVEVLLGATDTLRRLRPKVQVECHLFMDPTLEEQVRKVMAGLGYVEAHSYPYHSVSHSLYLPPSA